MTFNSALTREENRLAAIFKHSEPFGFEDCRTDPGRVWGDALPRQLLSKINLRLLG